MIEKLRIWERSVMSGGVVASRRRCSKADYRGHIRPLPHAAGEGAAQRAWRREGNQRSEEREGGGQGTSIQFRQTTGTQHDQIPAALVRAESCRNCPNGCLRRPSG